MSGEEASSSGAGSGSCGGAAFLFDYSTINNNKNDRNTNHNKPPMFNGDPEMFSGSESEEVHSLSEFRVLCSG